MDPKYELTPQQWTVLKAKLGVVEDEHGNLHRKAPKPRWRLAYAAPELSASVLGFTHAHQELKNAQRDLIQLASIDPRAAAGRVRRIQCDQRRIWRPQVLARLHPVRPRLNFSHDEGEDE